MRGRSASAAAARRPHSGTDAKLIRPHYGRAARRRARCAAHAREEPEPMTATDQRAPAITFYTAIPGCRSPIRADPSVLGTLPARGFQYCEALRAASSFGWDLVSPLDLQLHSV